MTSVHECLCENICSPPTLSRHILRTNSRSLSATFVIKSKRKLFLYSLLDLLLNVFMLILRFNQRSTLMIHISRVHENGDSCVCDVCARFFKCSISYERHYRNEHTNLTEKVQCDLCGNWLKHSESLREHMRRHQASSETCKLCGHVSANIKAMRAHIRSAHTAATLPCAVCGKMFKKPQTLKVLYTAF